METVTRNVRDLDQSERSVLERVVGHQLRETQQIIVNVVNIDLARASSTIDDSLSDVPDSWKIYDGLSDAEIDTLDGEIRQRANLTRQFE
jgi:hypothetical protein